MEMAAKLGKSMRSTRLPGFVGYSSLLGVSLWAAQFVRATRSGDGGGFPAMNGAFEFMFDYGRLIALATMVAAFALYQGRLRGNTRFLVSSPSRLIIILNAYISIKLLYYGNIIFAFEAAALLILSYEVLILELGHVEKRASSIGVNETSVVTLSFLIAGFLIVVTNIFALVAHPDSAINDNARMHGVTGNPQALGMQCALVAPAFMFSVFRNGALSLRGIVALVLFSGIIVIQYYTGSRMGFAAVIIGLVVFFRNYIGGNKMLTGIVLFAFILIPLIVLFGSQGVDLVSDRFIEGREDTRSDNLRFAWETFLENPFFGVEPQGKDGRLLFVENFFLASASTGGIIGGTLAALILAGIVRLTSRIRQASKRKLLPLGLANFYLASTAAIIAVSTFEACLLGIIATHTMFAYMVLSGAASHLSLRPQKVEG